MTEKEAKKLQAGMVVEWNNDPNDLGTVMRFNACGFYVEWECGQRGWIDCRGAEMVNVHQEDTNA